MIREQTKTIEDMEKERIELRDAVGEQKKIVNGQQLEIARLNRDMHSKLKYIEKKHKKAEEEIKNLDQTLIFREDEINKLSLADKNQKQEI